MSEMRFTVVDEHGSLSFLGPCYALKMLAAACSQGPHDSRRLLRLTSAYDPHFSQKVLNGLAVFDEHNSVADHRVIQHQLATRPPQELPPFRVLDEQTRRASMQPARAGLVMFNLKARRIVQVLNSYAELERRDRGRLRRNGRPIGGLYHYELPDEWSIVP